MLWVFSFFNSGDSTTSRSLLEPHGTFTFTVPDFWCILASNLAWYLSTFSSSLSDSRVSSACWVYYSANFCQLWIILIREVLPASCSPTTNILKKFLCEEAILIKKFIVVSKETASQNHELTEDQNWIMKYIRMSVLIIIKNRIRIHLINQKSNGFLKQHFYFEG